MKESRNMPFSAVFIICPLQISSFEFLPYAVSIVKDINNTIPGNMIKIQNTDRFEDVDVRLKQENKIGVCIKPGHFDMSQRNRVIEFIELYRLLGVNHFTFYNISFSEKTDWVLRKYVDEGIVEVIPWKMNLVPHDEIRYIVHCYIFHYTICFLSLQKTTVTKLNYFFGKGKVVKKL